MCESSFCYTEECEKLKHMDYDLLGNRILEAIGAKIRLNDDQAIDNDINDGENYNLSFNKYNIESELLVGIDVDKKFKFFNGSTLIIPSSSDSRILSLT